MQSPSTTGCGQQERVTHERFIHAVRELVLPRLNAEQAAALAKTKMVYGAGNPMVRGLCYYGHWHDGTIGDLIEICAFGEESLVQLAGTTVHELAHVLAGRGAGHGRMWKRAAKVLGLHVAKASGQTYSPAHFDPALWNEISLLPPPADGRPTALLRNYLLVPPPCPLGVGTRMGTSRGPGSGSRLKLWLCACEPPVRVRVARKDFGATCHACGQSFRRPDGD